MSFGDSPWGKERLKLNLDHLTSEVGFAIAEGAAPSATAAAAAAADVDGSAAWLGGSDVTFPEGGNNWPRRSAVMCCDMDCHILCTSSNGYAPMLDSISTRESQW